MSVSNSTTARVRGSGAVKAALVDAAAQMLGEFGPRGISVRDVADRAGVNHGQVHHYFGGKRALLEAAMRHLAHEAFDHSSVLAGNSPYPPVLAFAETTVASMLGKVARYSEVVSDRLHGVLAALLVDRRAVVVDNSYRKLSSYYDCWLRDVAECPLLPTERPEPRTSARLGRAP